MAIPESASSIERVRAAKMEAIRLADREGTLHESFGASKDFVLYNIHLDTHYFCRYHSRLFRLARLHFLEIRRRLRRMPPTQHVWIPNQAFNLGQNSLIEPMETVVAKSPKFGQLKTFKFYPIHTVEINILVVDLKENNFNSHLPVGSRGFEAQVFNEDWAGLARICEQHTQVIILAVRDPPPMYTLVDIYRKLLSDLELMEFELVINSGIFKPIALFRVISARATFRKLISCIADDVTREEFKRLHSSTSAGIVEHQVVEINEAIESSRKTYRECYFVDDEKCGFSMTYHPYTKTRVVLSYFKEDRPDDVHSTGRALYHNWLQYSQHPLEGGFPPHQFLNMRSMRSQSTIDYPASSILTRSPCLKIKEHNSAMNTGSILQQTSSSLIDRTNCDRMICMNQSNWLGTDRTGSFTDLKLMTANVLPRQNAERLFNSGTLLDSGESQRLTWPKRYKAALRIKSRKLLRGINKKMSKLPTFKMGKNRSFRSNRRASVLQGLANEGFKWDSVPTLGPAAPEQVLASEPPNCAVTSSFHSSLGSDKKLTDVPVLENTAEHPIQRPLSLRPPSTPPPLPPANPVPNRQAMIRSRRIRRMTQPPPDPPISPTRNEESEVYFSVIMEPTKSDNDSNEMGAKSEEADAEC